MLPKPFTLSKPVDNYAVALEHFLALVSSNALQAASGTYTGTGLAKTISVPFSPKLIILSPFIDLGRSSATTTGNMVFSLSANVGVSWIPATGFVKDCVTSVSNNSFTLGSNAAVNTVGTNYIFLAVG